MNDIFDVDGKLPCNGKQKYGDGLIGEQGTKGDPGKNGAAGDKGDKGPNGKPREPIDKFGRPITNEASDSSSVKSELINKN